MHQVNKILERFSIHTTRWAGSSWAFAIAVLLILLWVATGPIFEFSETWQLVINTGTTIITFLMVFLIQRSQNKESEAVQVKLNELLATQRGASNSLINAEDLSEDEIRKLHKRFSELVEKLHEQHGDRESHSIAEMQEALEEAHESLHPAHAREDRSNGGPADGRDNATHRPRKKAS